jgi:hypothetical protein
VVTANYRGAGTGVPVLLLVATSGGNIPIRSWIDERVFVVTAIYADFWDSVQLLPPHVLVVNAIGDADLCADALAGAERIIARTMAPVINLPRRVRSTGRAENARRLGELPGVIAPMIRTFRRDDMSSTDALGFPLLLRSPGFHTGQHFVLVEQREALAVAVSRLPGEQILAIEYLDARGPDGMARKYRVMFVDGVAYPLHLAISADWKVHYFSGAMATDARYRREEQSFLEDMPGVLGSRVIAALEAIRQSLGLDYAGIDFGLSPDGMLLLFEANATMVIVAPDANPIWNHRRRAIEHVLNARARMLWQRIRAGQSRRQEIARVPA